MAGDKAAVKFRLDSRAASEVHAHDAGPCSPTLRSVTNASVISGDIAPWEVSTTCNGWGRETDRRNTAPAHSLIESPDACVAGTTPLRHVQATSFDSATLLLHVSAASSGSAYCELGHAAVHAAQESHVAGDNAVDALVTGSTPLLHVQAASFGSAYCELSRAAMHAAHESHAAGDNAIDALV